MTGTAETEAPEFAKIYNLDVTVAPTNRPLARIENPISYTGPRVKSTTPSSTTSSSSRKLDARRWSARSPSRSRNVSRRCSASAASSTSSSTRNTTRRKPRSSRRPAAKVRSPSPPTWPAAAPTSPRRQPRAHGPSATPGEEIAEKLPKGEEKFVDDEEFVYFFHVDGFYRVRRTDWERVFSRFRRQSETEHEEVVKLGGLHILGTERHEARRIDNQLRGRAGRQGDPGSSRFYLSLEDDLMRIFGSTASPA